MFFYVGDLVTRNSHNNDLIFKIVSIENDIAYLSGVNIRLCADSEISDLKKLTNVDEIEDDRSIIDTISLELNLDRNDYFFLPGKILHIDSDENYLNRCMNLYNKLNVMAYGVLLTENSFKENIIRYLDDLNPDIVVVTGHDSFNTNTNQYKNSNFFIDTVKEIRKYEKNQDLLVVIAGACQSNYEELIKAGATFASSPKRINIHALDPAIIASSVALSNRNEIIDLKNILNKTNSGDDGFGGIAVKGSMFVGYPR